MKSNHANRRTPIRRRAMLLSVLALLVIAAFAVGDHFERMSKIQTRGVIAENIGRFRRIEVQGATYVEKTGITTILVLGVDKTGSYGSYGARQGGQADFLTVLAIDHAGKTIYPLQIDRDTMTEIEIYGILGNNVGPRIMQLCLAHGYGKTETENNHNTVNAVRGLLQDIPIDYYMTLNLNAIGVLNNALGGVTVTLDFDFTAFDPQMTEGKTLRLNAEQAQIYTRFRLEVGDGTNESRMRRQREYLRIAGEMLTEKAAADPNFAGQLFDELGGDMTTNMSRGQLINELNTTYHYAVQPMETFSGRHVVGETGFMEFYPEEEDIVAWVLRVFYRLDANHPA